MKEPGHLIQRNYDFHTNELRNNFMRWFGLTVAFRAAYKHNWKTW
jgi:hypothetical protein